MTAHRVKCGGSNASDGSIVWTDAERRRWHGKIEPMECADEAAGWGDWALRGFVIAIGSIGIAFAMGWLRL